MYFLLFLMLRIYVLFLFFLVWPEVYQFYWFFSMNQFVFCGYLYWLPIFNFIDFWSNIYYSFSDTDTWTSRPVQKPPKWVLSLTIDNQQTLDKGDRNYLEKRTVSSTLVQGKLVLVCRRWQQASFHHLMQKSAQK